MEKNKNEFRAYLIGSPIVIESNGNLQSPLQALTNGSLQSPFQALYAQKITKTTQTLEKWVQEWN